MTFEIWQVNEDGTAALLADMSPLQRLTIEHVGRQLGTIDAIDAIEAQDKFAAWSRERCPAAVERDATAVEVEAELVRAL